MFKPEEYFKQREKVIQMIKNTHKWESTEGFIADGLISPKDYEKSPIKIGVVLGESYGYDECGVVDIEKQLDEDILGVGHPNRQTSKKVPTLLWMIFESLKNNKVVKRSDIPDLFKSNDNNLKLLQNSLKNIAWINVKKSSKHIDNWGKDATRQNYNEIYTHALKNKEILNIQLESIKADLLILCSNPVCDSLCDMNLIEGLHKKKKWIIQTNLKNQKIIHVSHPSYYKDWSYDGIHEACTIIFKGITNN